MESRASFNGTTMLNSAIAGYAAGSFSVLVGHPLDSAKVWIQTNTAGKNKHLRSPKQSILKQVAVNSVPIGRTASMSTLTTGNRPPAIYQNSFRFHHATKTIRALYSGACGPLLTVGIVQSINFTTYDTIRRILHKHDHPNASSKDYLKEDSFFNIATAGLVAGSGLAVITSPLIRIKNRQQITGSGFKEAIRESLYESNGRISAKQCFRGFFPHFLSESFGRAIYYCAYEKCKRTFAQNKANKGLDATVTIQERMISAGLAGIVCWACIYPVDVVRSRIFSQEGPQVLSTTQITKQIFKEGALYKGFWLTVLRAGPVAAAVLPAYDIILEKLSSSP